MGDCTLNVHWVTCVVIAGPALPSNTAHPQLAERTSQQVCYLPPFSLPTNLSKVRRKHSAGLGMGS